MKCHARQLWTGILFLTILPVSACARKQEASRILINVTQGKAAPAYINGYRRTLSGQVLAYHSSHPDADSALLVRANKEAHSISWETDPLPSTAEGDFYRLIWLAGLEREGWPGKTVHKFDFYINGQPWFTFRNLKDAGALKWKVTGRQGSELSFESTTVDRAGDLFGYMFLKVPRSEVTPGMPLTLQVTGEDKDSLDWYMTLQYSFKFTPTLRAESALVKEAGLEKQLLRLSFDNLQEGRSITISAAGTETVNRELTIGVNIVYVSLPVADFVREVPVTVSINGEPASRTSLWLKPAIWRNIYLLPYSHNDIGYTDLQPAIERKQWENLDEALSIIKQTRSYPSDAQFRWNLEVLWPLESYMAQASESRRKEVIQDIREGRIGLNALYANVLTGLANAEEMSHFTDYARRFSEKYGVPVRTALVSDIPGFTWGMVPALAHSGVKYFASAPNSGDRIGYVIKEWGDKPFYWESQSGQEKVLMWVAGASYSSFHEGDLTRLGDEKILKLTRKLDDSGYPYDILQLPYTIGGDNGPPDPNLSDFVRKWNERYASPRLIIATHAQMFADFEGRYGPRLPAFRGDFTPYWEDGAASTAFETALNRRAVNRLIQGETIWSLRAPASFPADEYRAAWRNAVLWDEHTWGAHNSVTDPDLPSVKEEWRIKRQFALDADAMSRSLLEQLAGTPAAAPPREVQVDVYNTSSWQRTDIVLLERQQSTAGDLVVDENGNAVPSQRLSTGELAVRVEDLPPFSARRLTIRAGRSESRGRCAATAAGLSNSLISMSVDRKRGTIQSLVMAEDRIEFVDRAKRGLNEYLYVPGKDPGAARQISAVRVLVKERGPLVASLLVEADAPGCAHYSAEYRVVDGLARVDIINRLGKLPVRAKESIHIAFPFDIPGGQVRYDVAGSIVRPEADQLPGSCKNFFSLQSWADVSNPDYGITWTSPDAPLIEIGAITAERPWATVARSSSALYSYLMNNYWHTNYKADQEGSAAFRYSLVPHAAFLPAAAVRHGMEAREPLLALPCDGDQPLKTPLFRVEPQELIVTSLAPLPGGNSWLFYLYNPTETTQTMTLDFVEPPAAIIHASDSSGSAGPKIDDPLKVPASGTMYVRLDRQLPVKQGRD